MCLVEGDVRLVGQQRDVVRLLDDALGEVVETGLGLRLAVLQILGELLEIEVEPDADRIAESGTGAVQLHEMTLGHEVLQLVGS